MFCDLFGHRYKLDVSASTISPEFSKIVNRCSRCGDLSIETKNTPIVKPLTAERFIHMYKRNYINYAGLLEVAFTMHDEAEIEYERLTDDDRRIVVDFAKKYAANA